MIKTSVMYILLWIAMGGLNFYWCRLDLLFCNRLVTTVNVSLAVSIIVPEIIKSVQFRHLTIKLSKTSL